VFINESSAKKRFEKFCSINLKLSATKKSKTTINQSHRPNRHNTMTYLVMVLHGSTVKHVFIKYGFGRKKFQLPTSGASHQTD